MGRGGTQSPGAIVAIPSSSNSSARRRFIGRIRLTRLPYHRLDEIHEEEGEEIDLFPSYIQEEEEGEGEEESRRDRVAQELHPPRKRSRSSYARMLRSLLSSSSSSSSSRSGSNWRAPLRMGSMASANAGARRRNRWRRMRLRICTRVRLSWLSPLEFLKKLRKAYIQAMISLSSKESQCGIVMLGSPWSFPIVVPFNSGA